ncbi:hypothetical protein [Halorhabdus rudnickae]|nr:hypothetical protein [Halorhabdus rudnickae]
MKRNTTVDAGDGSNESLDLRLTIDVAGRRLVYAESDLKTIGFSANEL